MKHFSNFLSLAAITMTAAITTATSAVAAERDLTVFTYDSFAADWGPAPQIEAAFEAQCECDLKFVSVDVSGNLISRLKLEGENTDADVVLGLDTALMPLARETGLIADHNADTSTLTLPGGWSDPQFMPFDFGYFAFVYNRAAIGDRPLPTSFAELAASDLKIVIQDPRTSTPGLGLLLWIKETQGDAAAATWEALSDNIVTVTKGWSEAYGLFLEGEADLVLSYTTSPAYHAIAEGDDGYAAVAFDAGHYAQVEVAAALKSSDDLELAREFMAFIASTEFQSVIPTTNWMYPVTGVYLPDGFEALVTPSEMLLMDPATVADNRDAWIGEWLDATSK